MIYGIGIFSGVYLHHGRTELLRGIQLPLLGIDEQGNTDAGLAAAPGRFTHGVIMPHHVQPALGGQLLPALGHHADVVRPDAQRVVYHLAGHRAFEVHARLQHAAQDAHVLVLDVAPVLAQVDGDGVCTRLFADQGGAHQVGIARAARLAQRGDVVYVQTEFYHCDSVMVCVWANYT